MPWGHPPLTRQPQPNIYSLFDDRSMPFGPSPVSERQGASEWPFASCAYARQFSELGRSSSGLNETRTTGLNCSDAI
ncbi:hypothetical protein HZ326_16424 [Fusarium oxysporum f. sp. albedinis]|nr:hypothetical protein HZ326_16424 [Fusarium oxysporum f. sp. albedinis]